MGSFNTKSKAETLKDEVNQYRNEIRVAIIGVYNSGKTTIAQTICEYDQHKSNIIKAKYNFSEFTILEHVPNINILSKHSSKNKKHIDWIVNKPTNVYSLCDIEYCQQMIKTYAENPVPQLYFDEKIICNRSINKFENNLNLFIPQQIYQLICKYYQIRWIVNSYKTIKPAIEKKNTYPIVYTDKIFEFYDLSNVPLDKCSLMYERTSRFIYVLDISKYDQFYEINEINGNEKRINK
eukprot:151905_1